MLKVGTSTIVEFLQKKGFAIKDDANTKISEEQYILLLKEFGKGLDIEKELAKLTPTSQKVTEKETMDKGTQEESVTPTIEKKPENPQPESIETKVPEDMLPKFKTITKIDLDNFNQKKEETIQPKPTEILEKPQVEERLKEENVFLDKSVEENKEIEIKEEPKPTPIVETIVEKEENDDVENTSLQPDIKQETTLSEELFSPSITKLESKINVIGKIDLDSINQQTRPKKKSKEEKKKERETKDKERFGLKKTAKTAGENKEKEEKKTLHTQATLDKTVRLMPTETMQTEAMRMKKRKKEKDPQRTSRY